MPIERSATRSASKNARRRVKARMAKVKVRDVLSVVMKVTGLGNALKKVARVRAKAKTQLIYLMTGNQECHGKNRARKLV